MDQTGPWQVVPRQIFTLFVILFRVGCLEVTGVVSYIGDLHILFNYGPLSHYLCSCQGVVINWNTLTC